MVRYYEKNLISLINSTTLIRQKWIIIGIILILGLVKVNAEERCCYSTTYELETPPNTYLLNLTASHVDSKKGNNKYNAAISFPQGYTVLGDPYSPLNEVRCSQVTGTGSITQYQCDSKDNPMFFVIFHLSVLTETNASITVSEVYIFGDKCQSAAFCTDLAAKNNDSQDDKISLGPLGTWPRFAVIIGGIILGISFLVACYFVYRRNRPDDSYRDKSVTPGTNYDDKGVFSPNSLLRDDDGSPPPDEPPKNTLIKFDNVSAQSPERTKSVRNRNQHQQSLKKSSTRKKKENKDRKSDDDGGPSDDVVIEISDELEKSSRKTRRNKDKNNNNVKNVSDYSTSDLSKTISNNDISDREWSGSGLSDNNSNEYKHSTSIHRNKSKSKSMNSGEYESKRDKKSSNNNNNNKPRKSSNLRESEGDREDRKIDRTSSRRHHSSTSPSSAPKSTSDLQKGPSVRTRQSDRDRNKKSNSLHQDDKSVGNNNRSSRSDATLDRKKSGDVISHDDAELTSDSLPLAMLANTSRSVTKSDQSKSSKPNDKDDDDTTPLGRISSYSIGKTNSLGATSISSKSYLIAAEKPPEDDNNYSSILDEVLAVTEDKSY